MDKIIRNIQVKYYLAAIILLSLLLRLVTINQSLWLDEAIGALVAKNMSAVEILTNFMRVDNHPPLYYILLKYSMNMFGSSEFGIRLLSVIAGVVNVYFVYKIAKVVFNKSTNFMLASTLLIATAPLHVYYSQEARMYVMASLFATTSFYYFLVSFEKSGDRTNWFYFSLSVVGLLLSDYVAYFLLPVFVLYPLWIGSEKQWWRNFLSSLVLPVVVFLIWLPKLIVQLENARRFVEILPQWQEVAGGANLKQAALVWVKFVLGRISFYDKLLYYSLVIVASAPFAVAMAQFVKRKISLKHKAILLWLTIPFVTGFLVSFVIPAFNYFRFLFVLPAFYLLIVCALEMMDKKIALKIFISILFVNLVGMGVYFFDQNQHREDWKGAVTYLESRVDEGDVVLFTNPEPFAPVQWYGKGNYYFGATDSISANEDQTKAKVASLIQGKGGVYYFEYLSSLHDPNLYVWEELLEHSYEVEHVGNFNGIGGLYYFILINE